MSFSLQKTIKWKRKKIVSFNRSGISFGTSIAYILDRGKRTNAVARDCHKNVHVSYYLPVTFKS